MFLTIRLMQIQKWCMQKQMCRLKSVTTEPVAVKSTCAKKVSLWFYFHSCLETTLNK